jgi:hypothetical protein
MPSICFDGAAGLRAALIRYGVLPSEAI